MSIAVLDLELSNNKMIEIGACIVNFGGFIEQTFSVLINQKEPVLPEIVALTGITTEEIQRIGFFESDAIQAFHVWLSRYNCRILASWGTDHEWFELNPRIRCLDVKAMATIMKYGLPGAKRGGGLRASLEAFGLAFDGRQHRALTDAINTAQLLLLFKEMSFFAQHIDQAAANIKRRSRISVSVPHKRKKL